MEENYDSHLGRQCEATSIHLNIKLSDYISQIRPKSDCECSQSTRK